MPPFKVTCPFCKKTVCFTKYGNHLLSRCHLDIWIKQFKKEQFLDPSSCKLPYIKTVGGDYASCCFGCKSGYMGVNDTHVARCKKRKEHFEALKSLSEKIALSDGDASPSTSPSASPSAPLPSKEIEALKKEIESLKRELKDAKDLQEQNKEDVENSEKLFKVLPIILGETRFYLTDCETLAANIKKGKSKSLKAARGCSDLLDDDPPAAPATPAAPAPVLPSLLPPIPESPAHSFKSLETPPSRVKRPGKQITLRDSTSEMQGQVIESF